MRRILIATSVLLTLASSAGAAELVITQGGRRITAANCSGWSYDPAPVAFENNISNVYTTSGTNESHCTEPIPFGDQIWRRQRDASGVWSSAPVIGRTNFRWMFGDQPIDSQTYIGRVGSPSVVRANGRYFMAFIASVSDPGLCSGQHSGTVCGLCSDPFSYFAMFWAMSNDGSTWHVLNNSHPVSNLALETALLYRSPNASDKSADSRYLGVTRVRTLLADGYIWFLTQFSAQDTMRTIMFRAPWDAATEFGITGPLEAWRNDTLQWIPTVDGVVPDVFADPGSAAGFDPPLVSIADISQIQGVRFIGLETIDGNRRIQYRLSNDLLSWTPPKALPSEIRYFADGTGYVNSVVDPALVEDGPGALHLFFASNDGDPDHGIPRDGVRDCTSFAPNGLGIYEGIVEITTFVPLPPPPPPPGPGRKRAVRH